MPESFDLEAFGEIAEDIAEKTIIGLSVIHICYFSYLVIRLVVKDEHKILYNYKDDPLLSPHNHLKDDPSLSDSSLPRNHLKGLKEIGETYIGETYSVFRQASFISYPILSLDKCKGEL
ncbi:hypothetical protein P8452_74093 [Trifolium repens]|nr:hypothetical protein P8452_74093 [Trifolium repens]